jgi:hypothetical protein
MTGRTMKVVYVPRGPTQPPVSEPPGMLTCIPKNVAITIAGRVMVNRIVSTAMILLVLFWFL